MPAPTRTSREAWIEAGLTALADGGPDAVRIDVLAQTLGVSRGGFYHQYESRPAFLEEMLDTWERRSTHDVLDRVEREGGDARTKVGKAGMLTFSDELLPVDLAVRDWARRDAAVADRLRRVDNSRMAYLRSQIATFRADAADVEALALLAFSLAIGNHFVAADHDGRSRANVLRRATELLLA
ncbi:TetR/AcrR family transcriptional regulator [Mycolicibacterium hodleri]|uniref:TetR/AcrR family transcriptional regulator n=1 Tax=Mycolicibacterium hodleri TaxID=49897 RepID=A0A502EAY6_9MYCO|nr:TetR/AcrR family transcriptional regulator [Mycolicibacterium hodleri]TPG33640.1 TetR/AcrR family transcriptional regulator [Mycolicibacterium hodleri]